MKDTYVHAKLVAPDLIRLCVFSNVPWEKVTAILYEDGKISANKVHLSRVNTLSSVAVADFKLSYPLELGHSYFFVTYQYGPLPLDVTEATSFSDFDSKYYYAGNDLGYVYSPNKTAFAVWAPLASKVLLKYKKNHHDHWSVVKMNRSQNGVYRAAVEGNLENYLYRFAVTNNEIEVEVTDPYAKGSTANGTESVVINFSSINIDLKNNDLPSYNSPCDAIIYEGHVRDMTIDPCTDIEHKGRFLGLIEKGRKTPKGNKAGFDYFTSLGFTHLQLLPIYDYKTVDELHPELGYNWGYDPAQYFIPEGSYASDLNNPLSRIIDCKKMIAAFHEKGIRIVMDVVYNHVYEYQTSVFEKIVPNYYFRHRQNGKMANTSGCGNDLASERLMVRKLIVDSCKHWVEEYGINGFRFDLMGIIDCETLNAIKDFALKKDKNFLLYGEGWNMGGEVKQPLGHMGNYKMLPEFGFFNDFYRETMKQFFLGDYYNTQLFKNAFCSSSLNFVVQPKFLNGKQTINYVECHDNNTFYDFMHRCRNYLEEKQLLELIKVANATVMSSFGVPFFHMGQEIGQSKWDDGNTYNKGDGYNKFSYRLLDERIEMSRFFQRIASLRKRISLVHVYDPEVIDDNVYVGEIDKCLHVYSLNAALIAPYQAVDFFLNPSDNEYTHEFDSERKVYYELGSKDFKMLKSVKIPPRSVVVAVK